MSRALATILCGAAMFCSVGGPGGAASSGEARAQDSAFPATAHEPRAIVDGGGGRQKTLPVEPALTESLTGKQTVVHYTLAAGPDQAPDAAFAASVQQEAERALSVLGRVFKKPLRDGTDGRLHVYVKDLGSSLGRMVGTPVGGASKQASCYLQIHAQFQAIAGATWQAKLRDVCVHETMHGVQNAYSAFSSEWFREGQATWAEAHFNGSTASLAEFLALPGSVANQPSLPLWDTTGLRHYSTALFFHFLVAQRGVGQMARWLDKTATQDDAMAALHAALGGKATAFQALYRAYLLRLYQRRFRGVASTIIPAVPEDALIDQLGAEADATIVPTGAVFRRVTPDARIPNTYLYAEVKAAASGSPEMLVVKNPAKSSQIVTATPAGPSVVKGFRSAPQTLLILTDTSAATETSAATTIDGLVTSPYIVFKSIDPDTPITVGQTANINITYDLIGVPPSPPLSLVDFVVVQKNANVIDRATEERLLFNGVDRIYNPVFRTFPGTPTGPYFFTFAGIVPALSVAPGKRLPRSTTSIKTRIDVN